MNEVLDLRNLDAWRAKRAPFHTGLALGLALLLLPLAALGDGPAPAGPEPTVPTLPANPTPAAEPVPSPGEWDSGQALRVLGRDSQITEMSMADYLWGVVAAEMPADLQPVEAAGRQPRTGRRGRMRRLLLLPGIPHP